MPLASITSPMGRGRAKGPGEGCRVFRILPTSHPLTLALSPWERGLDRAVWGTLRLERRFRWSSRRIFLRHCPAQSGQSNAGGRRRGEGNGSPGQSRGMTAEGVTCLAQVARIGAGSPPCSDHLSHGRGRAKGPGEGCRVFRILPTSHPLTLALSPWERGLDRAVWGTLRLERRFRWSSRRIFLRHCPAQSGQSNAGGRRRGEGNGSPGQSRGMTAEGG